MSMKPELSLTAWLDPALKYFSEQARIPVGDVASTAGGIGEGFALNGLTDVFTKGWLSRLLKLASGGLALGYSGFGKEVPSRLRKDLLALGMTMAGSGIATDPLTLKKDAEGLAEFVKSIMAGDWTRALSTGLATPGEISAKLGIASTPTVPTPTPTPTPSTGFSSKPSAPAGKSKYVVT